MILFLLLALGVHPPELMLTAIPGQHVELPLILIGNQEVTITGTDILHVNEEVSIKGKTFINVQATISPTTPSGIHDTYLYIIPKTSDPLVSAAAINVQATIKETNKRTQTISGTATQSSESLILKTGASLASIVTLLGGIFGVRVHRRKR